MGEAGADLEALACVPVRNAVGITLSTQRRAPALCSV